MVGQVSGVEWPETFDEFMTEAFGLDRKGMWDGTLFWSVAHASGARHECFCGQALVEPSDFQGAVEEHYDLSNAQIDQLASALYDCEAEVSEDEICSYHQNAISKD